MKLSPSSCAARKMSLVVVVVDFVVFDKSYYWNLLSLNYNGYVNSMMMATFHTMHSTSIYDD